MSYLFAAYLIIWVFLFGYLLHLQRKTNRLLEEIESLKARLPSEAKSETSSSSS